MTERGHGLAVAFDGPDGVGKTTQISLIDDFLREQGYRTHSTRASGGTPIGEALREASLSDNERSAEVDVYISLAMHTALGHDLVKRKAAGEICLIDRSPLAIIAYNIFGSQLKDESLGYEAAEKMLKLWDLDALIVFRATQQALDKRRHDRTDKPLDYYERQGSEYHTRVTAGYEAGIQLIKDHPEWGIRLIEIDASPDKQTVHEAVRQQVQTLLP